MTLPAYINSVPDISERAVTGIGTALPPHVSIRGNKFTLVDGAGNKKLIGDTLDFLVADIGDHPGKMFYANPQWTPDSDDPPDCWSTNGVGPSRDAINPQARTCAECPNNVRGSRISAMGSSIKACRDEVIVGIVIPALVDTNPKLAFQFKITPGSFKNWRKHVEEAKNVAQGAHVAVVVTRATFDPEQSGVVVFKAVSYPNQATWDARTALVTAKVTDILVGRLDRPRELPASPTPAAAITHQPASAPAQTAGFGQTGETPASTPQAGSTSTASPSEPQRRHRRTKAEIAADEAAKATQAPAQPQMAPFRPEAAPAGPSGNGAAFGIASNPSGPSADIQASLDAAFGAKPAGGGFGQQ